MERKIWNRNKAVYCSIAILISLFIFSQAAFSADEECRYCGMKRADYGHSWVIIEHDDGSKEGVCSVHCAAIDMALHIDNLRVQSSLVMPDLIRHPERLTY